MRTQHTSSPPRLPHVAAGQMVQLFAVMLGVIGGMVALAVDVGHVYQQRQQMQNTAVSAAEAGAYETYGIALVGGVWVSATDTQDYSVMRDVAASAGYAVINVDSSGNYLAPPSDACRAGYTPNQVYLQAEYLDATNAPIMINGSPALVGNGVPPSTPSGVKVLGLGGCVPGFFSPILGRQNFTVAADAQAGLIPQSGGSGGAGTATQTPIPTVGGSGGATATATILSTLTSTATFTRTPTNTRTITSTPTTPGSATPTGTATMSPTPTVTPTVDTITSYSISASFMIFGQPPTMLYAEGSTGYPTGDTVTMFGNSGGWASSQYANSAQGLSGTPLGVSVHDSSMEGCLNTSQTSFTIDSYADFNHGGVGHCGNAPSAGAVVAIPVVNEVLKNDPACSANGGYCEVVKAIVLVRVTFVSWPHTIQGVIVGVVADPYNIVQLAPSPTATPTVTPTFTNTATPRNTSTITPTRTPVPTFTFTPVPPLP